MAARTVLYAAFLERAQGVTLEHLDEGRRSGVTSTNDQWVSDSGAYLRPQTAADAWTQEAAAHGGIGTQSLLDVALTVPPTYVGRLLGLEPGSAAVLRSRLISLDGRPVELASSWYPAEIAAGTPLAERRRIRGGAITCLAGLGHHIATVTEDIESRLADAYETDTLQLSQHEPVLVLTRLARNHDGEPIEASVMITPGTERRLRYEMKVD
jgi:DNA-binding GntR family transcriptional regulator